MEKLLELLNEYDKEKGLHTFWKTTQSNKIQIYGKGVCSESYLYSKSYGFVEWLCSNDKINREGMKGHGRLISYCLYIKSWEWDKIKEGVLLMLLAISDTPIDDLISYLR